MLFTHAAPYFAMLLLMPPLRIRYAIFDDVRYVIAITLPRRYAAASDDATPLFALLPHACAIALFDDAITPHDYATFR